MSALRIALVCPYDLDVPGGVQNHVLGLAAALRGLGHDAHVLAPGRDRHEEWIDTVAPGHSVTWNGSHARITMGPRTARTTAAWLDRLDPDVVHVHEPAAPSVGWLALRRATGRWPTVATFHQAGANAALLAAARTSLGPALGELGAAICVSASSLHAAEPLRLRRPTVIGNGFDADQWEAAATWPRSPAVAFVGRRDDARKGFGLFAAAARALQPQFPHLQWWALGPGGQLPDPVTAPAAGPIPTERLQELVGRAQVVVAPNTGGESFGLVLVEALAAGAQVVAADLPAFRQVLSGSGTVHGHLHRRGDLTDLTAVLGKVLSSAPDPDVMSAGQEHARTFGWERVLPRIMEQYQRAQAI